MSESNNGGPAFPDGAGACFGMTLRDYFAAKAMQAILSLPQKNHLAFNIKRRPDGELDVDLDDKRLSRNAYSIADAMLEYRDL